MEKLSLQVLTLDEMEKIEGAGSCASQGIRNFLVGTSFVIGVFNPAVALAGMAYYAYCNS